MREELVPGLSKKVRFVECASAELVFSPSAGFTCTATPKFPEAKVGAAAINPNNIAASALRGFRTTGKIQLAQ
jgi:hypothetical protein